MAIFTREIIHVTVNPTMSWEEFRALHKIAHYTAILDRDDEGRVIWDDDAEFPYLESAATDDFQRLQSGEEINWELPKPEE
jgi:hypothetical protein